jgi:hypothetical protein
VAKAIYTNESRGIVASPKVSRCHCRRNGTTQVGELRERDHGLDDLLLIRIIKSLHHVTPLSHVSRCSGRTPFVDNPLVVFDR